MTHIPAQILLFDGNCVLCNGLVRFILRWENNEQLHFAPLKSEIANQLAQVHPEIKEKDSVILITGNQIYTESDAAVELAKFLKWPFRVGYYFRYIPKSWRDFIYQFIASNRYKWWGRTICELPHDKNSQNRFHR
jgi:predicted DCC family thiol-disulfide oxidoreductase YuxK